MPTTSVIAISEVTALQSEVELALHARGFQPAGMRSALTSCCDFGGGGGELGVFKHHRSCLHPGKLHAYLPLW